MVLLRTTSSRYDHANSICFKLPNWLQHFHALFNRCAWITPTWFIFWFRWSSKTLEQLWHTEAVANFLEVIWNPTLMALLSVFKRNFSMSKIWNESFFMHSKNRIIFYCMNLWKCMAVTTLTKKKIKSDSELNKKILEPTRNHTWSLFSEWQKSGKFLLYILWFLSLKL